MYTNSQLFALQSQLFSSRTFIHPIHLKAILINNQSNDFVYMSVFASSSSLLCSVLLLKKKALNGQRCAKTGGKVSDKLTIMQHVAAKCIGISLGRWRRPKWCWKYSEYWTADWPQIQNSISARCINSQLPLIALILHSFSRQHTGNQLHSSCTAN